MKPAQLDRWIVQAAALAAVTAALTAPAQAKVRSNTQVRLPNNAYLGDVNGDGRQDFIHARGCSVYVANTDYWNSKILYSMLKAGSPIARLFTGDFQALATDQICAIHTDGQLSCWTVNANRTAMTEWFTMSSFIGADEEVIVGDFNGDYRDDILVYKPSTGQIRHFLPQGASFVQNPTFQMGNISPGNIVNKKLFAGEFGQALTQSDLLVFDPATGQISRYDAVNAGGAYPTFWWAFTTGGGFVASDETVAVANVEGSNWDDVVLRSTSTGAYRFFRASWDWSNWNLIRIILDSNQLPIVTGTAGMAFWLRNRGSLDPSSKRDDQMFYEPWYRRWTSTHARVWGNGLYYWWAFSNNGLRPVEGDADGDQRTDLSILGNPGWWTIPLATSKGDGTFGETNTATSDPGMPFASWAATPGAKLVRGDFDGDGLSDLALVGGKFWWTIPVAFSKSDGSYRIKNEWAPNFPAWAQGTNVKAVSGDFNGDGKSDIALVGELGRHNIPVAYSLGDGTFDVAETAAGGFPDLATSRDFYRNPQVWPKVVTADFNNDGKTDIALVGGVDFYGVPVALSLGREFRFEYQSLTGEQWATDYYHSRAREPGTHAVAGDFDGNGFSDLALVGGSLEATNIFIALNYGNGQFGVSGDTAIQAPLFAQWAEEPGVKVVSGYFNDDAIADIALVGGIGWTTIRLALSNGGMSFRPTNYKNNFGTYATHPGVWPAANVASTARKTARSLDQNGDRLGDISLTGGVGWGSMPVALSHGNGDFTIKNEPIDAEWASFAAHSGVSVLAGDYNGDGKADVALTTPSGFPQMVAFATGNGVFSVNKIGTSVGNLTSTRAVAGDFNGDGRTDIMAIGGYTSSGQSLGSTLYQSNGNGTFLRFGFGGQANELANFINSTSAGAQIVAGDFNGDGASDLAVMGGPANDWVHVYFTVRHFPDAGDLFQRVAFQNSLIRTQLTQGAKVVAGDFDADGLDDLYLTRTYGPHMTVGLSLGTGAFSTVQMAAPNVMDWSRSYYARPVVGDFDGDGASDLALVGGRDWTSVPVAFSTRRTDLLPWVVENRTTQPFALYATYNGALAATDDPTDRVDTVAPPPPTPDPPETKPYHASLYIPRGWIDMPLNPIVYDIASWTFEFHVCNDNEEDESLILGHVVVRETYLGPYQWYIRDWLAKDVAVRQNGTWADYRGYVWAYNSTGAPPNDDTRPYYPVREVPGEGCRRLYIDFPGTHASGLYQFDVFVDEVPPVTDEVPHGSIVISCPPSANGTVCSVARPTYN